MLGDGNGTNQAALPNILKINLRNCHIMTVAESFFEAGDPVALVLETERIGYVQFQSENTNGGHIRGLTSAQGGLHELFYGDTLVHKSLENIANLKIVEVR
jgi:hypothetical protein